MATATLSTDTRRRIEALRDRYPHPRSAILPSLWAVQDELGFVSPDGMREVADILRLTPSEVQAVSTFYSMYFDRPGGRHHAIVCVNVSCALRGADDICAHLEKTLGCPSGSTTADGEFTWESTVECLGACGGGPAMQIDHHFHENLTTETVDAILEQVRLQPAHGPGHAGAVPRKPTGETPPAPTAEGPPSMSGAAASPPAESGPGVAPESTAKRARRAKRPKSGGDGPAAQADEPSR